MPGTIVIINARIAWSGLDKCLIDGSEEPRENIFIFVYLFLHVQSPLLPEFRNLFVRRPKYRLENIKNSRMPALAFRQPNNG